MCDASATGLPHLHEDEYVLDTPIVRSFIAGVRSRVAAAGSPNEACELLRPVFEELLAERDWLPETFQSPVPDSGMGGGIGQWLLYRSADRSLSLFSLVVPSGSKTPIHDHLAWGLIGLLRGNQDEELYRPTPAGMELSRQRPLQPGDTYALLPPTDDIHCVRTTSDETSVSIHLLANDTGCTQRHTYDELTGQASPFISGYANAECAGAR
jgi:3-mercaptopropionate dioxygenase